MATIVLVHGAFQGGWVWQRMAEALSERGHTAHRPTLSGCGHHRHQPATGAGLRTFIQEIIQYIRDEGLIDVVLVGHSYAGLICCGVADALPDAVSRLVLVDGVLPQPGLSFADMGGEPFRNLLAKHTMAGGLVRPWPLESFGVGPEAAQWFQQRLGLFPREAFTEPCQETRGISPVRRTYISCIPAKNPLLRAMAARAGAEGWEMHALASGHCAMVSAPLELAGLLHSVAKSAPLTLSTALPPYDRQLLEDMRRQLHWTCCRLAQIGEGLSPASADKSAPAPKLCGK